MTETLRKTETEAETHPGQRQAAASDPLRSVWVGASAGTGKTKVLIDRLLRLMLPRPGQGDDSATPPEKILCLTFTKTAAAEMSNRICRKLGDWSVKNDADLEEELRALTGAEVSEGDVAAARRLFARVLDTPGGLRIMTIHSFCQSVLKRFPVEAGLPPHFEMMDEGGATEYLTRCLHDIIAAASAAPESGLGPAFSLLALHMDAETMSALMRQVMAKRSLLSGILAANGDTEGRADRTVAALARDLGVDASETVSLLLRNFSAPPAGVERDLRAALQSLLEGSSSDIAAAGKMQAWLEDSEGRPGLFEEWRSVFLTNEDTPRARFPTKKVRESHVGIEDILGAETARVQKTVERLRAVRFLELNAALLTVAAEMTGRYARYKRMTDRLDFDDLIIRTRALLEGQDGVPWVLFKLDGGIDHILVDEAQDTSPAQWDIIRALCGEFYAGAGAERPMPRTLFVVGDEKQSIFSFQGADPQAFSAMQAHFSGQARQIQEGFEIFLEHSFRSTRAVLEVVDAVFAAPDARAGVVADVTRDIRHLPFRTGHAGRVELWPLLQAPPSDTGETWEMPLSVKSGSDAGARLAAHIAATIRGWIDSGEVLPSKGRPLRAGDILILVQSRSGTVELLMRALKSAGVPVAGIDRMTLTEEIAVMDLLSLARFALLPRDDLALAEVLRSPLVGIGEEGLFTLCYGRDSSLWAALQERMPEAADWLSGWIAKSCYATPYEFFAHALNAPCFADPVSGRRAFYGRLGGEIHDALDEFLNAALQYEQSHTPALQAFVDWFLRGEAEIKREQEQQQADQVRIMTVHASKGLQAPVVILPDAGKKMHESNHARPRLLWPEDETGLPLWSPRGEFDVPQYAIRAGMARARQEEEYRRLLYVALTRAEDRLYVCGSRGSRKAPAGCWHELVAQAFPSDAENMPFVVEGAVVEEGGASTFIRRVDYPQEKVPDARRDEKAAGEAVMAPLPDWAFRRLPDEPLPPRPLSPSRPGEDEPAVRGPLAEDEGWKFRRGVIVHRILEVLPDLPPETWERALGEYLARPELQLEERQRSAFAAEVLGVLHHPAFAPIFGPGSQAEIPVTGLAGKSGTVVSGQIDRMLVTRDEVLIVDYKTNRPPPKSEGDVSSIYLKQLAAYASIIHNIYPMHKIRCALLWTDGPFLMPVSEERIFPYLL